MSINPYADNFESGGFFYNAIRQDLAMVHGDTLAFGFQIQGLEGDEPDEIVLSVKENLEDDEALITVSTDDSIVLRSYDSVNDILTYTVRIPPQKAQELATGRYFYDLVAYVDNDVITMMKGRLAVDYSVSENI